MASTTSVSVMSRRSARRAHSSPQAPIARCCQSNSPAADLEAVRLNAAIKRLRDALGLYPSPHPPPLPPPPGRRRRRQLHRKPQQNGVRLWTELSLIRNWKLETGKWKLLSVA